MTTVCYLAALALNILWLWLGDKLSLGVQMAVPFVTVAAAGLGLMLRCSGLERRAVGRHIRRGMWALLLYYLFLLYLLLFYGGVFNMERGWGGSVNLEPLRTIRNYLRYYRNTGSFISVFNLLGNVVILVPLGVLLPVMFRPFRHFWTFLPLAAAVACGVEYLQWVTATGAADVDDSIVNFAGAALGYFFTRTVQLVYRRCRNRGGGTRP